MTDEKGRGPGNLRKVVDNATPVRRSGGGGEGGEPQRALGPPWLLPEDAPVIPLGVNGDNYYYLDALQQLRIVKDKDHSRLKVQSLFGHTTTYFYAVWPRLDAKGNATGWMPEAPVEALMRAASERGVWDVVNRVRGAGAWRQDDGSLVFHCGDTVWRGPGDMVKPGLAQLERYVYPSAPAVPRPAEDPQRDGEDGPAHELLVILKTWRWKRGEIDAVLLLGWIGAALVGGALPWRPLAWITGGSGTGKSTVHDILRGLFGDAILSVSNVTAAGIWQTVRHSSLPVAVDEIEAKDDNRRATAIIELAREAASGTVMIRGGQDHESVQFTARSCFLFSSINIPPLMQQDVNRLAILELDSLKSTTPPALVTDRAAMNNLGRALRRRLADQWHRFDTTLETWRAQLASQGHSARGADQFGVLLTCADLLLSDAAPEFEVLSGWTDKLSPEALRAMSDDASDEQRCLDHLLTSPAEMWKGGQRSPIGRYIRRVADVENTIDDALDFNDAVQVLADLGLRVEFLRGQDIEGLYLCVANSHQGLARIYKETHWAGKSGATGGWRQTMMRLNGARSLRDFINEQNGTPREVLRFGSVPCRCICIPIKTVFCDADD